MRKPPKLCQVGVCGPYTDILPLTRSGNQASYRNFSYFSHNPHSIRLARLSVAIERRDLHDCLEILEEAGLISQRDSALHPCRYPAIGGGFMNPILQEWLSPASLAYLAGYLQFCQNSEMLSELRVLVPPEALKEATKRLSAKKRQQIKEWVLSLNSAREVEI